MTKTGRRGADLYGEMYYSSFFGLLPPKTYDTTYFTYNLKDQAFPQAFKGYFHPFQQLLHSFPQACGKPCGKGQNSSWKISKALLDRGSRLLKAVFPLIVEKHQKNAFFYKNFKFSTAVKNRLFHTYGKNRHFWWFLRNFLKYRKFSPHFLNSFPNGIQQVVNNQKTAKKLTSQGFEPIFHNSHKLYC